RFQHRRRAAVWIDGAKHPSVAMITHNYPAILFRGAINPRDHVPERARLIVHVRLQSNSHVTAATYVIRKRKAALKTSRAYWPFQWLDQSTSFVVREWLHRNARNVRIRLF